MKNILLIIDVQKGFVVKGINDHIVEKIDQLINTNLFDCIISTVYRNYENSPIINLMGWNKLLSTDEQQVVGEALNKSHHFLYKNTYSAYSDELVELLKKENEGNIPSCIYIVGFDTECCVLKTATDLFETGIRPIVLTQYCGASSGDDAHIAGIRALRSLIGNNNLWPYIITSLNDINEAKSYAENSSYVPSKSTYKKASKVIELLVKKQYHISFAESCTGGMVSAGIVDVASASKVLDVSIVTYANEAKIKYLGVNPETIELFGVVSEEVAGQMAKGVSLLNNADVGVGISGIAGPTGATLKKPLGMVCFGFYIDGQVWTYTKYFGDLGRSMVRLESTLFVYEKLIELLE